MIRSIERDAVQALGLMDLTSLNDDDDDASTRRLAASATTPHGHVAALCVFARFVPVAKAALAEQGGLCKVAVVANFPHGEASPRDAAQEVAAAVALGADEVDVVFPWRALMAGDEARGRELVRRCRDAVGTRGVLKVIVESGELRSAELIRRASEIVIEGEAHFIKTSTGKVAVNATPTAAEIMLQAIRDSGRPVGFKAAGGVRSLAEASAYLALAARIMGPGWLAPERFRFGASGLLQQLLAVLYGRPEDLCTAPY